MNGRDQQAEYVGLRYETKNDCSLFIYTTFIYCKMDFFRVGDYEFDE